jgi:hypothetical protein
MWEHRPLETAVTDSLSFCYSNNLCHIVFIAFA